MKKLRAELDKINWEIRGYKSLRPGDLIVVAKPNVSGPFVYFGQEFHTYEVGDYIFLIDHVSSAYREMNDEVRVMTCHGVGTVKIHHIFERTSFPDGTKHGLDHEESRKLMKVRNIIK